MFRKLALMLVAATALGSAVMAPTSASARSFGAPMAIMAMAVDGAIGNSARATAPGGATGTPTSATSKDRQGGSGLSPTRLLPDPSVSHDFGR
jgi:hypothetical protein